MEIPLKCVVVGDDGVGKTCLLISFATNSFPEGNFVPTFSGRFENKTIWKNQIVSWNLLDSAGNEEFDKLRPLSYPETNVFLVCFSLLDTNSFLNVKKKWIPELTFYSPGVPFVLVGTKSDLSENVQISNEMGNKLKSEIGAYAYRECSAKTQHGLRQVFELAVESIFEPIRKEKLNCFLM
jgi:Ras-related C3 botulinum toxin substrate 1